MKSRLLRSVLLACVVAALAGTAAFAQQYVLSFTTLNGAINATQTSLVLTSASALTGSSFGAPSAGQCLFVDQEFMRITATSSTTMTVVRDRVNGSPHATLATVYTGPCTVFKTSDPVVGGNQTCSAQPHPWINVQNANVWICPLTGTLANTWQGSNVRPFTYGSVQVGP